VSKGFTTLNIEQFVIENSTPKIKTKKEIREVVGVHS
jgi:hypothetical protein